MSSGLPEVGNKVSLLGMVSAELLNSVMYLLLEGLAALSSGPKHQHDPFHVQKHGMLKEPRILSVQILQP